MVQVAYCWINQKFKSIKDMECYNKLMENVVYALIGGVLIGISTSMMLLFLGRITGVSGILFQSFYHRFVFQNDSSKEKDLWRWFFLAGLVLGGFFAKLFFPQFFNFQFTGPLWLFCISGLLVGIGTKLGSGCTSGHGVCGIPRLSIRSIIATILFIFSGAITVFIRGAL